MIAEIADAGLAGAKCKAEQAVKECGKPSWSLSYGWCMTKQALIPPAVCLAKTEAGQKKLAKLLGEAQLDEKTMSDLSSLQENLLGAVPAAAADLVKCLGNKVGWSTLIGLTATAASGGGHKALVEALKPHLVGCGALAVIGSLGSSPIEQAIKEALSSLAPSEFDQLVATYLQGGYTVAQAMQLAGLAMDKEKASNYFGAFIETKEEFAAIGKGEAPWQPKQQNAADLAKDEKLLLGAALVAALVLVR